MTPLTETELLRMREVQAKAMPGRWYQNFSTSCCIRDEETQSHVACIFRPEDRAFAMSARTDWPRLTEWALEARRVIYEMLQAYPWRSSDLADEARRLLGVDERIAGTRP